MKKIALFSAFFIFLATTFWIRTTKSFFNDTEEITGNVLSVATSWVSGTPTPTTQPTPIFTPTPQLTLTPSPTPISTPELTPTPIPTSTPLANHLVINEVYYNPDSEHMQGANPDENNFEWIEIYNPTTSTINLKNWKIVDNSGSERSISESNRDILPGDFVIIAKADNVRVIWGIPNEKFIGIGQIFGNGLANAGDRVVLKDNLGNIVDQMSYGNDKTAFDPACPDVAEGHSLERSPAGKDTDTAADFIDRYPPTPGS